MKIVIAVLSVVLLCQVPVLAQAPQTPSGAGNPALAISSFLGFSETHTLRFLEIINAFQSAMQSFHAQMEPRQRRLQELMSMPQPDPASVGQALLEIRALEIGRQHMIEEYHNGFVALLSSEQIQKVQAVVQARQLLPAIGFFAALQLIEPPPPSH